VKFVPVNDVAALEAAFGERTAGIVLEMIQGEGGIYPLTAGIRRQGARTGRPLRCLARGR
jgi:acetylornithine/succinyldiaminopimelate/putrescine aminotransferase